MVFTYGFIRTYICSYAYCSQIIIGKYNNVNSLSYYIHEWSKISFSLILIGQKIRKASAIG